MKRSFLAASALATLLTGTTVLSFADTTSANKDPMKQVEAVMQHAHHIQDNKRQNQALQTETKKAQSNFMNSIMQSTKSNAHQELVGPNSPASASAPPPTAPAATIKQAATAPSTTSSAGSSDQVGQLQAELSKLKQSNLVFQHQASQRIEALIEKDTQLEAKLSQLGQVLSMLSQEVNQMSGQIKTAETQLGSNNKSTQSLPVQSVNQTTMWMQYTQYGIFGLLVLIVILLLFRRGGQAKVKHAQETESTVPNADDIKDEYDFMGSDEATPSKLDLARAYLAMEDYKAAKKVLDEVMKTGNEEQRTEARKMLTKIPR